MTFTQSENILLSKGIKKEGGILILRDKGLLLKARHDELYMNELMAHEEVDKFIKYVIKAYTKNPARFMQQHKVEWDDLHQACLIGLYKGIKKLNLEKSPNEYVRYLFLSIQGEIREFSRSNNSNSMTISQRIRALYPKYLLFYDKFREEKQKDPTIEDTMTEFKISRGDAFDLVYGMQQVVSIFLDAGSYRFNINNDAFVSDAYSNIEKAVVNKLVIENYMRLLNEKQKDAIFMYFFLGYSKTEIARKLECANSMVHKYIESAFKKIRDYEKS